MRKNLFLMLSSFLMIVFVFTSCKKDTEELVFQNDNQIVEMQDGDIIPGEYIVVFNNDKFAGKSIAAEKSYSKKQSIMTQEVNSFLASAKVNNENVKNVYSTAFFGFSAKLNSEELAKLESNSSIKYIEEDKVIMLAKPVKPVDEPEPSTQEVPYGITRVNGGTSTASGTAWIIDSGIDLDHDDLNVDVSRSATFVDRTKDANDDNGHGTHVAGTVAAIDNDFGVIGVAPGATVVAVRVLDRRGSGTFSGVIAGIDYVGANGQSGDVANMSLGGPVSTALDDAVLNASNSSGVKFVLAAGNESDDASNHSPARVDGPRIYTISAMDINDNWAYFSNYGSPVDYCAPGVNILSTWKGGRYNTISGTSMAAPHAAGVLLLGNASTDGRVNNDPDGNADPIIVH